MKQFAKVLIVSLPFWMFLYTRMVPAGAAGKPVKFSDAYADQQSCSDGSYQKFFQGFDVSVCFNSDNLQSLQ